MTRSRCRVPPPAARAPVLLRRQAHHVRRRPPKPRCACGAMLSGCGSSSAIPQLGRTCRGMPPAAALFFGQAAGAALRVRAVTLDAAAPFAGLRACVSGVAGFFASRVGPACGTVDAEARLRGWGERRSGMAPAAALLVPRARDFREPSRARRRC